MTESVTLVNEPTMMSGGCTDSLHEDMAHEDMALTLASPPAHTDEYKPEDRSEVDPTKDVSEGGAQTNLLDLLGLRGKRPPLDHEMFGLITEAQFAEAMGVQTLTAAKWRREGEGPAYTMVGKAVFYQVKNIYAWLDKNTFGPNHHN